MPRIFAIAVLDHRCSERRCFTFMQKFFNSVADTQKTPLSQISPVCRHYTSKLFVCLQTKCYHLSTFSIFSAVFCTNHPHICGRSKPLPYAVFGSTCVDFQPNLSETASTTQFILRRALIYSFYFIGISIPPTVTETISSTGSGAENVKM